MLAGRDALGTDLNPLAVMLARAKTHPRKPEATAALVAAAQEVAAFADARRKAKQGATRRLPQEDVAIFAPHVLLELDGLRAGIEKAPPEARPDLQLVFSSILVKLSAKRGDTSDEPLEKRVSAGYPARLFVRKTEELAQRFAEFAELLPKPPPRARVLLDDAAKLAKVDEASVDAVDHVAARTSRPTTTSRITSCACAGSTSTRDVSRRTSSARDAHYERLSPDEARASWERELAKFLRALARVTKRGAPVVLAHRRLGDAARSARRASRGAARRRDRRRHRGARRLRSSRSRAPRKLDRTSTARPWPRSSDRPRAEHALLLSRI